MKDRRRNRIVDSFFGAAQARFRYDFAANGAILRAYPWWPIKFIHLEVTWEKREDWPTWEFAYLGTGYSVHLDCRHSDIDLMFVLARGLESRLGSLKRRLSQDIYVPGRYKKSSNELFMVEDMCRIPESDRAPVLVGCRLAQYAATLLDPIENLLRETNYFGNLASVRLKAG